MGIARTVDGSQELSDLPPFTVVQFRGAALGPAHQVVWQLDGAWFPAGSDEYMHTEDFPPEVFPAAVLWMSGIEQTN